MFSLFVKRNVLIPWIKKFFDMHGIKTSKNRISNVIIGNEKQSIIVSTWKEDSKRISEKGTYSFKSF